MVSPLPPLLENAVLKFKTAIAWKQDLVTGLSVPDDQGDTIEIVAFVKPAVGALGSRKLVQAEKPGADTRLESLECYLIRPMEFPEDLNYQDGGTIERTEPNFARHGKINQIRIDARLPLVTSIVGRHLYITVEWSDNV